MAGSSASAPGLTYNDIVAVENDLGYTFRDKWLLAQAFLCPRACEFDNTRLAWIGDQVMELAICQLLYAASDEASVVTLNDRKMIMVKREFCAECTRKLGYEKLALAAPCNGQMNITDNMQAELFEAVLGAQFVDSYGDYSAVLASYRRIVSMRDLQPVFDKLQEERRQAAQAREAGVHM